MLDALRQDLRFSCRSLLARPAFTAVAVGTLAIGIGATTTIYTFVDNVLLRSLPYPEAARLVFFEDGNHPHPRFRAWEERVDSVEMVSAVARRSIDLVGEGEPARLTAAEVTQRFFELFGARPAYGRLLAPGDYDGEPVVVLSHSAWLQRWGGREGVVGSSLRLGGRDRTIVGVLDADFVPPETLVGDGVDAWLPFDRDSRGHGEFTSHMLAVSGRLAPGATLESAQAELDALSVRLAEEDPDHYRDDDDGLVRFPLAPFLEATVGGVSSTLWLLLGAAGLMLVLSCANVANLLLARGTDRTRELALRAALGAGSGRIVGQLLVESVVMALAAGVVGLGLAALGTRLLGSYAVDVPRAASVAVDLRVLLAALAAASLTGGLFGVMPALVAGRTDLGEVLKEGGRGSSAGADRARMRGVLVAAEIAIALVLVVGAALILNSFVQLTRIDPGFDPAGAYSIRIDLLPVPDDEHAAFLERITRAVAAVPGVDRVGAAVTAPFELIGNGRCCWFDRLVPERDGALTGEAFSSIVHSVDPGYFAAIGARFVHGRAIGPDADDQAPEAVLTESGALRLFGNVDVVGREVEIDGAFRMPVVGVVEDILHWGPGQRADQDLYVPFAAYNQWFPAMSLVLRTGRSDPGLAREVRQAIWSVAPTLPVPDVTALEELVSRSLARTRFVSILLGGFAAIGLAVAAAGIYGSLLYSVGRRTHELGVRLALGARPGEVVALVVRGAAPMVLAGLGLGMVGALTLSGLMESLLFGVASTDPATYGAVAAALGAVALVAAWLPARRASRTDPATTLRAD